MDNTKPIFIHLPKTGGTSINCAMYGAKWQTKPDFYYRHIDYVSKKATCREIFELEHRKKFHSFKIFTMFRRPADRLLSEFHFLKNRPEFFSLLSKKPRSFEAYCRLPETQNYCTKFLLDRRIFDEESVSTSDFELIKNGLMELPVHIGLFEQFTKSLLLFEEKIGIQWGDQISKKRITLNRPKIDTLPQSIIDEVEHLNSMDLGLYELGVEQLDNFTPATERKILFTGDKYDYVMVFARRFVLLEIDLKHEQFIRRNRSYFRQLNMHLFRTVKTGREYVTDWNRIFVDDCNRTFPNSRLCEHLNEINVEDPLDKTRHICAAIDRIFEEGADPGMTSYSRPLVFNED